MAKSKKTGAKQSKVFAQKRRFKKPVIIFFLLFIVAAIWVLSQSLFKNYPVNNKVQLLAIDKGETYSAFIQQFADQEKVKFPVVLKVYQKIFIHDSLKAGVYQVHQGMSIRQVLVMLSDANNAQMNRIAVIEGTTFKQLKSKLKADANVKNTILGLSDAEIMKSIGAEYSHPEGLFAPNTYFFAKGETDLNILKELYQHQIKALDWAWSNRAPDLPYKNKYEALIMASIVEKETALEEERRQVSGVFVRRLQTGMRLQTDPTVIYGMGDKYQGNIRREDLRTPTSYNTYTMHGLPPTPIALPSERSIEAALHPDQSKNVYFVATGNGGHKFSETLEQHNQAVREYLAVLQQKRQANSN
ncbi:endolytic transglycosylase MltG [Acinetobacter puyangensis]|uniref:endolytic transglycosylase MltG n=1 Tax=Acinetobacter puyangensis TaxID=1096779 RepID=UPI003A4D91DA